MAAFVKLALPTVVQLVAAPAFRFAYRQYTLRMAKKMRTDQLTKEIKTIGTHNGRFHCDEVLGCAMIKRLYPRARIVRSRDPAKLATCDIVLDVGGEYDLDRLRFDHHQKGFELTGADIVPESNWNVKLSSAGLIFCHFARDILRAYSGVEDVEVLDRLFAKVYENFIVEVDGIDNGVPISSSEVAYSISTGLSSRVGRLNRGWNEAKFDEEAAFEKAMLLVDSELEAVVKNYVERWWPARKLVEEAVLFRRDTDPSEEIIELTTACPWTDHYFDIEAELGLTPTVKFVLFESEDGTWRVQSVPVERGSFVLRVPLREEWRALRGPVALVDDAIFVHANGFIGGAKSRQGALVMARLSLSRGSNSN